MSYNFLPTQLTEVVTDIVHGDVKCENVLVFEATEGVDNGETNRLFKSCVFSHTSHIRQALLQDDRFWLQPSGCCDQIFLIYGTFLEVVCCADIDRHCIGFATPLVFLTESLVIT